MRQLFLVLMVFAACPDVSADQPKPRFLQDELVIRQDTTVTTRDLLETLGNQLGAKDGGEISPTFPGWRKILLPKGTNLEDAIKYMQGVPGVLKVEPNYLYYTSAIYNYVPKDKGFKNQWGLFNYGQKIQSHHAEAGADINVLGAWNFVPGVQDAAKDVVVAIIDSGVSRDHPDLASNIWNNAGENGYWSVDGQPGCNPRKACCDKKCNGLDDDGNGYIDDYQGWDWTSVKTGDHPQQYNGDNDPQDGIGHGTHVAGVIGAVHDKNGVAGINNKVQLMPVKFIGNDGSGSLEFAVLAIEYAVRNGADVINASWGSPGSSSLLADAVDWAISKGVLFVAAAGNDGMNNDQGGSYPANYDGVFSVVASDDTDRLARFSNIGRLKTHIAAPGVDVFSTYKPFLFFNKQYVFMSGTSMATPQVAGVAAMLIGLYPDKFKHHPEAVMQRLMDTSDVQAGLLPRTASGGRLNAYNAVAGIVTPGHYPIDTLDWSQSVPVSIESAHPYEDSSTKEWEIYQPGAKWIRLNFGRFSMEMINDALEIRDGNGRLIDVLTGFGISGTSRPIQGDRVKLRFSSNSNVTGWGFELKNYEVSQ